jgi:hypothetical protein
MERVESIRLKFYEPECAISKRERERIEDPGTFMQREREERESKLRRSWLGYCLSM